MAEGKVVNAKVRQEAITKAVSRKMSFLVMAIGINLMGMILAKQASFQGYFSLRKGGLKQDRRSRAFITSSVLLFV